MRSRPKSFCGLSGELQQALRWAKSLQQFSHILIQKLRIATLKNDKTAQYYQHVRSLFTQCQQTPVFLMIIMTLFIISVFSNQ